MGLKVSGTGHFTIPTAPAAGVSCTSGAANVFTTTYVQLTASVGLGAVFITGVYMEAAAAKAATYIVLQLAVGAAASEVIVGQYLFALDTASTVALNYRPIFPPILVPGSGRISCKTADSVGSAATLISLECITQANVVDDGTIASSNIVQWSGGTVQAPSVTGAPMVDCKYLLGTIISTPATAGIIDVNVKNMNNVSGSAITTIKAVQGLATDGVVPTVTNLTNAPTNGDLTATMKTSVTTAATAATPTASLGALDTQNQHNGTAQAGAGSTITLVAGASATNDLYKGSVIKIYSGTGAGQSRVIIGYVGSTKVATVNRAWATNPDATSVYAVFANELANIDTNLKVAGVVLADTVTTYTGNTVQTGDSFGVVKSGGTGDNVAIKAKTDNLPAAPASTTNITAAAGIALAASQHVITDSGTVTTLTNLPAVPTDWLTAAGVKADAVTKIQAGLSTYAGGAVASVTGAVGSVTGAVGSITGITFPTNFSSLVIDATGRVNAFLIGILTTVFTEGAAGRIAAAFKQFFNIATPAATMDHGVLVDTVTTYTGNTPQTRDCLDIYNIVKSGGTGDLPSINNSIAGLKAAIILASGTSTAAGASTITLQIALGADALPVGQIIVITSGVGPGQARVITGYVDSSKVVTVDRPWTTNPTGSGYYIMTSDSPKLDSNLKVSGVVLADTVTNLTNLPSIPANWLTAAGMAAAALNGKGDWNIGKTGYALTAAYDPAKTASQAGDAMTLTSGERTSIGTAVWATTVRSLSTFGTLVADVATAVWAAATRTLTAFGFTVATTANATETAIKTQTDKMAFTVTNQIDANIQSVNDVTVNGNGAGTPWGP